MSSIIISIMSMVISLCSLAVSYMTFQRRRRQYQQSGDNSVQIQVGNWDEADTR